VADFSAILPTAVVSSLLGIPTEHHDDVRRWTDQLLTRDPDSPEISSVSQKAQLSLAMLAGEAIAERRHSPSNDIISSLVGAEIDGRPLTDIEITAYCVLLLSGGHETTSKLIAGGVRLFARHPDQRAIACQDDDAMRRAVEELLRYTSPTQYMARTTTREVTLYDTTVPAGAKVALLLGSGNRDVREFERPDDFDVTRPNKRILAFGHGAHACIGAAVARMEARVALDEFLRRFPRYTIHEDGIEYFHSGNVQGPAKVPLTVG
jgi:cytochrome P450